MNTTEVQNPDSTTAPSSTTGTANRTGQATAATPPTTSGTPGLAPVGGWTTPAAAPAPRTNVLGVVTLVLGILGFAIIPVITGHIALNQIKRTGEDGRAVTLVGLILGYVALAGYVIGGFVLLAIAFFATVAGAASAGYVS
jgi:hypothetical protein